MQSDSTPHAATIDCSIPLLREGYAYIGRQCRALHSDVFRGRLLGQPALFVTGPQAARLFYDESRFRRADAVPPPIKKTLFGQGGVQGLDDEAHRNRKAMFMSLMTKASIARFLELARAEWEASALGWEGQRLVLDDEAQRLLCRAACAWVGVQIDREQASSIARDCSLLFTSFVDLGPRMWRARIARKRVERWAASAIERFRAGELRAEPDSPLAIIAAHRDLDGTLLSPRVAAVELINLVRPITAIGRWVAWLALALRDHPQYLAPLREEPELGDAFVQEVRRYYPFTPLLGARARTTFRWQGARFDEGQLVLLDVYGTLRDPRVWESPEAFRPERFVGREPTAYDFIPHGGGEFLVGHRCAGEWLTIEAMKQALRALTEQLHYVVPPQDLSYRLTEIPARPKSGVILDELHAVARPAPAIEASGLRGADGMTFLVR